MQQIISMYSGYQKVVDLMKEKPATGKKGEKSKGKSSAGGSEIK